MGVLAEQRALRAAQHFDALDVERVEQLGLDARHHEVVDVHRDRRVEVDDDVGQADAADRERSRVERGESCGGEVRHVGRHAGDVAADHGRQRLFVDRRHRDRRGLQVGLAMASRGDEHFLETA